MGSAAARTSRHMQHSSCRCPLRVGEVIADPSRGSDKAIAVTFLRLQPLTPATAAQLNSSLVELSLLFLLEVFDAVFPQLVYRLIGELLEHRLFVRAVLHGTVDFVDGAWVFLVEPEEELA